MLWYFLIKYRWCNTYDPDDQLKDPSYIQEFLYFLYKKPWKVHFLFVYNHQSLIHQQKPFLYSHYIKHEYLHNLGVIHSQSQQTKYYMAVLNVPLVL